MFVCTYNTYLYTQIHIIHVICMYNYRNDMYLHVQRYLWYVYTGRTDDRTELYRERQGGGGGTKRECAPRIARKCTCPPCDSEPRG